MPRKLLEFLRWRATSIALEVVLVEAAPDVSCCSQHNLAERTLLVQHTCAAYSFDQSSTRRDIIVGVVQMITQE